MILQTELLKSLKAHKNSVAIEEAGKKFTYSNLLTSSNKVTKYLQEKKFIPGATVGVCLDAVSDIVSAIIGILNARCTFVLLDERLPEMRLLGMVQELNLECVLVAQWNNEGPLSSVKQYSFGDIQADAETEIMIYPEFEEDDSIYIYFTSGSTGKPKGIIGRNKSLIQFLNWEIQSFNVTDETRFSQFISQYFDAFLRDIFVPVLSGATICIPPKEEDFFTFSKLSSWLDENRINIIHCVPSVFSILNNSLLVEQNLKELKYVLMSGEKIIPSDLKTWYETFEDRIQLVNLYGATETTMIRCMYKIRPSDVNKSRMPIGDPIDGTEILIADKDLNPCNPLITGDLYIVTEFATKGYLNDEKLTQEKFIRIEKDSAFRLAFRTGDKARKLADGTIDLLGREDRQIKLRGIRIELEEIEIVLTQSPEVRNAIVVVDSREEALYAYIIPNRTIEDSILWEETISSHARQHLPGYMVPSRYIEIPEYPLLANGKIDYRALTEYKKKKNITGSSNDMEAKILNIWKSILGEKEISIDESFHSVGGSSLSIMRLIAKIFSEFNIRVSLSELFNNLTVQQQAVLVKDKIVDLHLSQVINNPAALPVKDLGPIRKAVKKEFYKTSSIQKGLYFLHKLNPKSTSYNFPTVMIFSGSVDREKIGDTALKLIERHQGLRTSFELLDGEPVQRVADKANLSLIYSEISEDQIESTVNDFVKPFDLTQAPLIRIGLAKINDGKSLLIVDMPHIISDEMTKGIMVRDFKSIYNNEQLPDLPVDYVDFAEWQQSEENKTAQLNDRDFWMSQFSNKIPVLELPLDFPRPPVFSFAGDTIFFGIEKDLVDKLSVIAEKEGTTRFVVFLSAFYVLLHRLTSQDDIIIGTSTLGRKFPVLDHIVGVFINPVGIRNQPDGKKGFRDFLKEVKQRTHEALDHQDYPFGDLINSLNLERNQSRNSLFDVMFEYFSDAGGDNQISGLDVIPYKKNNMKESKFDLSLHIHEGNEVSCSFSYSTDLFRSETISRFINYFKELLISIAEDMDVHISKLKVLPDYENYLLTKIFNDTTSPYPADDTIVSLFEDQVLKSHNLPALNFKGESLDYGELNERANRLAKYLSLQGVCTGSVLGLMVDRSVEMVIGMLAILKAGGGYLPIDPALPEKRIGVMMDQSQMMLLLTQEKYMERYAAYLPVININAKELYEYDADNQKVDVKPKDLAYCIFTSGSMGRPKGVMMGHKSVVNLVKGLEEKIYNYYGDKSLRVALLASYAFDASVQQIFGALLLGHCLCIAEEDDRKDGSRLRTFFNQYKIDLSDGTPTHLRILVEASEPGSKLESLSSWIIAGEILHKKIAKEFFTKSKNKVRLFNLYGPTETGVDSTYYQVYEDHLDDYFTIPIGKPLPNERIYITDSYSNLVPIGVVGELCIAGDGLAQRYVGDESMTSQKFDSDWIKHEQKVYHTGDLARWLPDGNIEYKGRADKQTKLRGYRIELGEIEHQLNAHKSIKSSIVVAHEDESGLYLIAYYVSDIKLSVKELRDYLAEKLPDYMIPSFFVHLKEFPLTVNGKIDTRQLPGHKPDEESYDEVPSGKVEEELADIWSGILKIEKDKIGRKSSFFELGGHSLRAVYLASRIHKEFNVDITLEDVFKYQILSEMSGLIQNLNELKYVSIPPAETKNYYPLSSSQRRLYFLYEFDKASVAYNLPHLVRLKGSLDNFKLEVAFNKLIARHESLRTSFKVMGDKVVQKIHDNVKISISFFEADPLNVSFKIRAFIRPFDLNQAPLIRVCVIKTAPEDHVLVVDIHHIVTDGISQGILIKDFMALYNDAGLPEILLQYKDYAEWQNSPGQQDILKTQQQFWINEFQGEVGKLELPADFERPAVKIFSGNSVQFSLSEEVTKSLKKLGENVGATPFMTILSLFHVLLSKLSNQQDIVVGVSTAGRGDHPDLQYMTGMFVNTLAIKNNFKNGWSFEQFLTELKNKTLSCFKNQSYQYEKLIEELNIPRDTNRNPLFDVLFFFQNFDEEKLEIPGLVLEPYRYNQNITKFDLTLSAIEEKNQLHFKLDYSTELFKEATIRRFVSYFQQIISSVIENPFSTLSEINILSDAEKQQQLIEFNQTDVEFAPDETIVDLFKEQVKRYPDKSAVVIGDQKLSYNALDNLSDILAAEIQISHNDHKPIAIYLSPSFEMIIAILAVLKSGNSFLPLDPGQEGSRHEEILKNSKSKLLITHPGLSDRVAFDGRLMIIDREEWSKRPVQQVSTFIKPEDLAYVIYTSGSTGAPKGVKICHKNLVNYVNWFKGFIQLSAEDKSVLSSSYAFDLGYSTIFPVLLTGGELHLVSKDLYLSPEAFLDYIRVMQITYLKLTPSLFATFVIAENLKYDTLKSLRHIVLGGESIRAEDINIVHEHYRNINFINHYGPTETTIGCVAQYISFESFDEFTKRPGIGKPIANTKCYILDDGNNLLPIGSKGELCVEGQGVGQGYLGDDDLSALKFIDNPFKSESKLYKTGDSARWLPNGTIEFLGRADDQVKVNGYRLSTKEVENYLLAHNSVNEAVVLPNKENDNYLIAFCVCSSPVNSEELRQYLSDRMPDYMVPSYFVFIDKMPLTDNGKLDKKALLNLKYDIIKEYKPASNQVEEKLVQIWSKVLKLAPETISTRTGFFELGGNSLKAIYILNNIRKEFEVEIKVLELFQKQTIYNISELIQNSAQFTYSAIPKVQDRDYYPTTSSQQRLYFLYEFDKNSKAYNMPQVVELKGVLEKDKLESAFYALISRHESLRTSFLMIDQKIVQKISNDFEFAIDYFYDQESEVQILLDKFIRPFDLGKGPLIRVGLIRISEKVHLLVVDMHHIITDGVSQKILVTDLMALYNNEQLPAIKLRYRDYAEWLQNEGQQAKIAQQKEFWKQQYSEELTLLELPTDFPRPLVKSSRGNTLSYLISREETGKLKLLAEKEDVTMFMIVLSLFYTLLGKLSNQEDISIGIPVAGRQMSDIHDVAGMFVNTVVLRQYPNGNLSYKEFLSAVKEQVLQCLDNQSFQYEELIKELNVFPDTSRNPLFDVMFAFKDFEEETLKISDLTLTPYRSGHNISKFDLTLTATESNDQIYLDFEYSTDLFKKETISQFISYFQRIITDVTIDTDKPLSMINILSEAEHNELLREISSNAVPYPKDKTVIDLFREQVSMRPDKTAVTYLSNRLSYEEVNERSLQIAVQLKALNVGKDQLVGILLEPSDLLLISILGILMSGGAFVPIDKDYPQDRKKYIIENSGLKILISSGKVLADNNDILQNIPSENLIDIDGIDFNHVRQQVDLPKILPGNLAYVIYTSGSTGVPKGVMINHSSLFNYLSWARDTYIKGEDCPMALFSSISFDLTITSLFLPLISGNSLHVYEQAVQPALIERVVSDGYAKVLKLTPSHLKILIECGADLSIIKCFIVGGEQFNASLAATVYERGNDILEIYNEYGPTEATIGCTLYRYDHLETEKRTDVFIGKPMPNNEIYILDAQLRLLPKGIKGEIYIGGAQLFRGYILPEDTHGRLLGNPYNENGLLYKTGDLARWNDDGNLEFLGRIDDQVKIRGYRVELGEIANQLITHPGIQDAIVVTKEKAGNKYLAGYYVSEKEIPLKELWEYLSHQLPDYMMPSYIIHLRSMPLNANNKIDLKALPEPEVKAVENYIAPSSEIEKKLVTIWSKVLQIDEKRINMNSSFFELGGHSLQAMQIVNSIKNEFLIEIKLVELFHKQTIIQQAELIELEIWVSAGGVTSKNTGKKVISI